MRFVTSRCVDYDTRLVSCGKLIKALCKCTHEGVQHD